MKIIKSIPEAVVVASWLKAELESARFSKNITKALNKTGISRSLLELPNLKDTADNLARKRLLKIARRNSLKQFPWRFVKWHEAIIDNKEELGRLYTPFGDTWLAFTNGQRLLSKAVEFISKLPNTHDPISHAIGVQQQIKQGKDVEPPILVTTNSDLSRPLCIIEGNVRCVSYYLHDQTKFPIRCYIAVSPKFASWAHCMDTFSDIRNTFINQATK